MKKIISVIAALLIMSTAFAGVNRTGKLAVNVVKKERVTNAAKQVINVTATDLVFEDYSQDGNPDYYFQLSDENGYIYAFDILAEIESGVTYTLDDMWADYCVIGYLDPTTGYLDESTVVLFESATFTATENPATGVLQRIDATVTGDDGNTYVIVFEVGSVEPQVFNVTATNLEFVNYSTEGNPDYYFKLSDDNGYIYAFDILADIELGVTYTLADMWASYCVIGQLDPSTGALIESTIVDFQEATFTLSEPTEGALRIDATVLGTDGNTYVIVYNESTSSIKMANNVNVKVYPNPVAQQLNVVADGVRHIDIIDAAGRVVLMSSQAGTIDLGSIANGVYVVRTVTNDGVNIKKIVKE